MTWTVAQDYCRANYTDLTSLRNDAEYQMIQNIVGDTLVWTGLFRDRWEWSDQTDSSLRYWKADKQVWTVYDQTCGAMLKNESGRWGELSCKEKHPFLCSSSEQNASIKHYFKNNS